MHPGLFDRYRGGGRKRIAVVLVAYDDEMVLSRG